VDKSFLSRLKEVQGNRYKYKFGEGLGLKSGTIDRIFRGHEPGPDILKAIALFENVSLNWLLTGQGTPYVIHCAQTDGETARWLDQFLNEHPMAWTVYRVTDGDRTVLVLYRPDQYPMKDDCVDYSRVEIIPGPLGPIALRKLAGTPVASLREVRTDPETLARLAQGEIGAYELCREDGILERWRPLPAAELARIAEQPAGYALEMDEKVMLDKYRRLPEDDKRRLQKIGAALDEPDETSDVG
jgi:transcriptional regulator with XRE-family HTH domain